MTTETLEIRQMARQFAQSDLRPHVEKWDHEGAIPADTLAQLTELGFFGMLASEESGGMAFDTAVYAAAVEEIAWGEPGVALLVAIANASGSDTADGRLELLADDQGGMFLVPGRGAGERVSTLGFRTVQIVRAAAQGSKAGKSTDIGLIGIAAIAIGIAQAALEHAVRYANEREQFSTRLREFEGIKYKLADMATRVEAARALLQSVCNSVQDGSGSGSGSGSGASLAKVFASEAAMFITTQAVQIFGGYGYMRDYPVEKLMRDAKATEMLEGANEALRITIADKLYS